MSGYKGYKLEDNIRRKANNTGDSIDWETNTNVKSYSTKPGQLSAKQQADRTLKEQQKLNRKQPVTKLSDIKCPVVRDWFLAKTLKGKK